MKRYLVLIIGLAILVRLCVPPSPDYMHTIWDTYRQLGLNVATGHGYLLLDGTLPSLYFTPGYAFLWTLGMPSLAIWLDGIVGPLLLYAAFKSWRGLLSALVYAMAFPVARIVTYQLPDSFLSLFSLATVCCVVIWPNWKGATLSGLSLGLALWFRSDFMALVPLMALMILVKVSWRSTLAYGVGVGVPLLLLGLFFAHVYGSFMLTRSGFGVNLWEGLGEYPNPWNVQVSDAAAANLVSTAGLQYATPAGDAYLQQVYLDHLHEQPLLVTSQVVQRFWHNLTLDGGWYENLFYALIPLSLIGFYVTRHRLSTWAFGALWLSRIVPFSIIHTETRYVIPLFVVYVAGAVSVSQIRLIQPSRPSDNVIRANPAKMPRTST